MFIAHYGIGFLLKGIYPNIPLGLLFTSVMACDLLFFLNATTSGIEYSILDKKLLQYPFPYHIECEFSHSLVGTLFLGAFLMTVYIFTTPRTSESFKSKYAFTLFIATISHWILDLIVHRPDLPLIPLRGIKFGFSFWNQSRLSNLLLEYVFFFTGIYSYLHGDKTSKLDVKLMSMVTILAFVQFYMLFHMKSEVTYMETVFTLFLFIGLSLFGSLLDQKTAEKPRDQ